MNILRSIIGTETAISEWGIAQPDTAKRAKNRPGRVVFRSSDAFAVILLEPKWTVSDRGSIESGAIPGVGLEDRKS